MKKYIAVAVLMLAVILSGCGGSKKSSTPPLNWDGLYAGTVDSGYNTWMLNITGNSPYYFAVISTSGCEDTFNITTDSWDSSQTSNVTVASGNCGLSIPTSQDWKLVGKTITIPPTQTPNGVSPVFTKQ